MKRYYILHYFDPANVGSFLLVSLLGLILVLTLVLLIAKLQIQRQLKEETEEKAKKIRRKKHQRRQYQIVESFYELVFSGTSILLFLSLYYIIDEVCRRFRCTGRNIRMWCFLSLSCSPSF